MNETPIPKQYKKVVDKYVCEIMDAAERLWPIVRELGETFECQNVEEAKFIVKIVATKKVDK